MEKFSLEQNGYNREEVNQFVGDVIKQTENIVKKCKSQQEEASSFINCSSKSGSSIISFNI